MAVITAEPNTPSAANARRSAWMPAPPPESEPAMVRTLTGFSLAGAVGCLLDMRFDPEIMGPPPSLAAQRHGDLTPFDSSKTTSLNRVGRRPVERPTTRGAGRLLDSPWQALLQSSRRRF